MCAGAQWGVMGGIGVWDLNDYLSPSRYGCNVLCTDVLVDSCNGVEECVMVLYWGTLLILYTLQMIF